MKKFLAGVAMLAVAATAPAAATTIVEASAPGFDQFGTVQFTYGGGTLNIQGIGNGYTTGPNGAGIDDIYITLLHDDGSSLHAFTGGLIGANDDSAGNLNSSLTVSLGAGAYLLAVSHCCAAFGEGYSSTDVSTGSGIHAVNGGLPDFQVVFSQDVDVTAVNGAAAVPEPAMLGLFGLGAIGLGLARRRKAA